MKTKSILFISTIITAVVVLFGCQKKPTACFTPSETTITKPASLSSPAHVDFTNCSTDGYTYAWDFGDGYYSTQWTPSNGHDYYTPGRTYDVKLTVYSKGEKKSDVVTVTITVDCETPTPSGGQNVTASSFIPMWNYYAYSYDSPLFYLDVAKDAAFTDFVSGYNNRSVTGPPTVTGLTSSTTYYFRVRACFPTAENSSVVSVTTN